MSDHGGWHSVGARWTSFGTLLTSGKLAGR